MHYSDFNIKPKARSEREMVGYYALSIASYHTLSVEGNMSALRHIAAVVSSGRFVDKRIKADADRFRKTNDKEVERMLKHVYLGKMIVMGFAGHIQKTYACMKLIDKSGKDIGVYINLKDKRGHIRSISSDILRLAGRFRGGGHAHAAGFSPDFRKYNNFKSESDRKRFLDEMERAAETLRIRKSAGDRRKNRSSRKPMFN